MLRERAATCSCFCLLLSLHRRSGGGMSLASSGYRQGITSVAPDGIQLSMLLGAGSFGRVYSGETVLPINASSR